MLSIRVFNVGMTSQKRHHRSFSPSPHRSLSFSLPLSLMIMSHASTSDEYIEILHQAASDRLHRRERLIMDEKAMQESLAVKEAISSLSSSQDLSSLSLSHLSTLLWSICRLGLYRSRDQSVLASCKAIASHSCDPGFSLGLDTTTSEVVMMVWSMSRLKPLVTPAAHFKPWFKKIVGMIISRMYELRPSDITSLITSLVIAKEPVSPSTCNLLALCCTSRLDAMSSSQLAWVISGLGKLRAPIQYKVLVTILDHYRSILPQVTSPEELSSVVFALTGLCYPNPDVLKRRRKYFLQDLALYSLPLIPLCSPRQLVLMVSGFTRLGFYPGVEWMRLHRQCCVDKRQEFDEQTRIRVREAYQSLLLN